jgi:hypothetical protein
MPTSMRNKEIGCSNAFAEMQGKRLEPAMGSSE